VRGDWIGIRGRIRRWIRSRVRRRIGVRVWRNRGGRRRGSIRTQEPGVPGAAILGTLLQAILIGPRDGPAGQAKRVGVTCPIGFVEQLDDSDAVALKWAEPYQPGAEKR